jgi:hypothetical protein
MGLLWFDDVSSRIPSFPSSRICPMLATFSEEKQPAAIFLRCSHFEHPRRARAPISAGRDKLLLARQLPNKRGRSMANLTRTTRDHEEIRRWAEERGGKPAHVQSTGSSDDPGILRIDFPGYSGEGSLEPISWDEWFEKFDQRNLALIYEEKTAGGARSNFNKIVTAETGEQAKQRSHGRGRSGAKAASGSEGAAKKAGASKKSSASKKSASKKSAASATRRPAAPARKSAKSASKVGARKTASKARKKAAVKGGRTSSSKKSAARKKR